ncbi:MAG: hypothetical protein ACKOTZ_01945 [Chloroflexota bacterium]
MSGAGAGFASRSDAFRYAWTTMNGDGSIVARLTGLTGSGNTRTAGVMIRESSAGDARYVYVGRNGRGRIEYLRRTAVGGSPSTSTLTSAAPDPAWLRITRTGNSFQVAFSANGTSWTTASALSLALGADLQVGLAVSSRTTSAAFTGTYTDVTVVP